MEEKGNENEREYTWCQKRECRIERGICLGIRGGINCKNCAMAESLPPTKGDMERVDTGRSGPDRFLSNSGITTKTCIDCGRVKETGEFYKGKACCKMCYKIRYPDGKHRAPIVV